MIICPDPEQGLQVLIVEGAGDGKTTEVFGENEKISHKPKQQIAMHDNPRRR